VPARITTRVPGRAAAAILASDRDDDTYRVAADAGTAASIAAHATNAHTTPLRAAHGCPSIVAIPEAIDAGRYAVPRRRWQGWTRLQEAVLRQKRRFSGAEPVIHRRKFGDDVVSAPRSRPTVPNQADAASTSPRNSSTTAA
jgi:hypothetical protein